MKIEEIRNMEITAGIHQWSGQEDGMTCGSLEIDLPNGTTVHIHSVQYECGRTRTEISIHNLNDTELTIFSKVKKSIRRVKNTIWTKIMALEGQE